MIEILRDMNDEFSSAGAGAGRARDKVSETIDRARDKVDETKDAALESADQQRSTVADKIQQVADKAREKAGDMPGGERGTKAAQYVADKAERTAGYIRSHSTSQMLGDIEEMVRRNPMPTLLGAFVVGVLIGRSSSQD